MKKYFIKYTFEFLVIVMGITVSFWLNNWNESLKETTIEKDLVNLLISDLENFLLDFDAFIRLPKNEIMTILKE